MTRLELIRKQTPEQLARMLCVHFDCVRCPGQRLCAWGDGSGRANGLVKWLNQEVNEE